MTNFIAIDFETANYEPSSVCSVGIVIVHDGRIADQFYSLIHPTPNYYNRACQRVHGLSDRDTANAPIFPTVWAEVEARIRRVFMADDLFADDDSGTLAKREFGTSAIPFVAHNAPFDNGCLRAAFHTYCMDDPDYVFADTLRASRKHFGRTLPNHQLHTVAAACGYDLKKHHHALADAEACAVIALRIL
ncbi:MAG: 3'-5' exoribonuclease [Bacteroidales bacterium]|nr:3'-5' exoribonuclease [Bacteroidales bacterium]